MGGRERKQELWRLTPLVADSPYRRFKKFVITLVKSWRTVNLVLQIAATTQAWRPLESIRSRDSSDPYSHSPTTLKVFCSSSPLYHPYSSLQRVSILTLPPTPPLSVTSFVHLCSLKTMKDTDMHLYASTVSRCSNRFSHKSRCPHDVCLQNINERWKKWPQTVHILPAELDDTRMVLAAPRALSLSTIHSRYQRPRDTVSWRQPPFPLSSIMRWEKLCQHRCVWVSWLQRRADWLKHRPSAPRQIWGRLITAIFKHSKKTHETAHVSSLPMLSDPRAFI